MVLAMAAGLAAEWAALSRRPVATAAPVSRPVALPRRQFIAFLGEPKLVKVGAFSWSKAWAQVEAPVGVYRWTLDQEGCVYDGQYLVGQRGADRSTGCTEGGVGANGSLVSRYVPGAPRYTAYEALNGHMPEGAVKVRVTLTDDVRAIIVPDRDVWFVVARIHLQVVPSSAYTIESPFRLIEFLNASGKVVGHVFPRP
jgi:hypothetical protein